MHFNRIFVAVIYLTVFPVFSAKAQVDRVPAGESRTLELVDQLKDVIQKAEKGRTPDTRLIRQLRDLVRRYDSPWRVALLYDDFHDGDYTANPSWVVDKGDFRVTRGFGLRTVFTQPPAPTRRSSERRGERSTLGLILDEISGRGEGTTGYREGATQPPTPSAAEISTALRISNSFAVKLQMTSRGNPEESSRVDFGLYQGRERDRGYRLAYIPGQRPAFALLRIAPGRSSVIEIYDQLMDLEDGRSHGLEWRRGKDGEMVVLLDDKEIIRTSDRSSGESFEGFTIVNNGGDYAFSQIAIFGSQQ